MCRPQPVNRRFRVSRYLARKSDPLCRHNVCYQSTYLCYPAVDSALDGQGVYESVLHSVVLCSICVTIPQLLLDVCVLALGEEQLPQAAPATWLQT